MDCVGQASTYHRLLDEIVKNLPALWTARLLSLYARVLTLGGLSGRFTRSWRPK